MISYDHFEVFAAAAAAEFKVALTIFRSAISYWQQKKIESLFTYCSGAMEISRLKWIS
ncbi:MAG: hypothetical protein WA364_20370 [Candidatus Nitrosopolaris sp.]